MHNTTIFSRKQVELSLEVKSEQVFVFHAFFCLGLGLSKIDFSLAIHTLITNNYMKNDKFVEIKINLELRFLLFN